MLAILGETGIGKSALLGAHGEPARRPPACWCSTGAPPSTSATCRSGSSIDALDDHVATLHPRRIESVGADLGRRAPRRRRLLRRAPPSGAGERYRSHRALRALIEMLGRERPVALLLDDLHWADDASIELVLHLLRRPARAPHLLAFALRPAEPAPRILHATRAAAAQPR